SAEARILGTALELSPRLGEAFARGLMPRVAPAVEALSDLREQAVLLEKGLYLAAHFDQGSYGQGVVGLFHNPLDARKGGDPIQALGPLLGQCFRGLRKLGMRDESGRLLERMAGLVLRGQKGDASDPFKFAAERRGPKAAEWAKSLKLLLHVAAGWSYFGQDD